MVLMLWSESDMIIILWFANISVYNYEPSGHSPTLVLTTKRYEKIRRALLKSCVVYDKTGCSYRSSKNSKHSIFVRKTTY